MTFLYLVDGGWSEWRPWSNCNVDCGEGKQTRLRDCTNPFPSQTGKRCEGDDKQIQKCDKEPCPSNIADYIKTFLFVF